MCRKLVTHYFLLTRDDLELWDSDPESFGKSVSYICMNYSQKCLIFMLISMYYVHSKVINSYYKLLTIQQ